MLQNRTYFFNVKENRMGDLYLNIVESKNRDEGGFDRQSIVLFADDLQEFLKGFDESLRILEKEVRQKRRPARASYDNAPDNPKSNTRSSAKDYARAEKRGRHQGADERNNRSGERPHKGRRQEGEGRRVVVRKRRDFPKE
jgi:hypothetical protein